MDLNFVISFIIGFIIAIIFSLEKVRLKFINISLKIFLKFDERKRNKLIQKALFSKNPEERTKAIKELNKMNTLLNHKKLVNNAIKLLVIYIIITSAILFIIGSIVNVIFNSPVSYILGWFIGFIVMLIKNKFF